MRRRHPPLCSCPLLPALPPVVPPCPPCRRVRLSAGRRRPPRPRPSSDADWQLQLNLERLAQIRRELKTDGAGDLLALIDRVTGLASTGDAGTASLEALFAAHNDVLSKMREFSSSTLSSHPLPSNALGRRVLPRSAASLMSSDALLQQSLPALITADLALAHQLLTLSPSHVNQPDSLGNTALSYAVLSHDLPLIAYLSRLHADPNHLSHSSLSPLALARLHHVPTGAMLRLGLCSRSASGTAAIAQEFWMCEDCGLTEDMGVCDVCATKCHLGHVLRKVQVASEGFCDCFARDACKGKTVAELLDNGEDAVVGDAPPFSFSARGSLDALTKENVRGLLRLLERVLIDTARVAEQKGIFEAKAAPRETATSTASGVGWRDVLVGVAMTAVLTPSFYALLGGAEDFAPAVYAVRDAVAALRARVHW